MRKIAVFTEGQSECIFVRCLLNNLCDGSRLRFDCYDLRANALKPAPYSFQSPTADTYFLLVNVGNDERVLSVVRKQERSLFGKGFQRIIAIRDMYSQAYNTKSPNAINQSLSQAYVDGALSTINKMSAPEKVALHYAIMEFEAWLLGMFHLFPRLHPGLTIENISCRLRLQLDQVDPETYYHPFHELKSILGLVGWEYSKSRDDLEKLCHPIEVSDVDQACAKSGSFCAFWNDFQSHAPLRDSL